MTTRQEMLIEAKRLREEAAKMCDRCGGEIGDRPTSGSINVNRESQIFVAVRRHLHPECRHTAEPDDYSFWNSSHPAFPKKAFTAQSARIEWGYGEYQLCFACNDDLLALLGEFFLEGKERPVGTKICYTGSWADHDPHDFRSYRDPQGPLWHCPGNNPEEPPQDPA